MLKQLIISLVYGGASAFLLGCGGFSATEVTTERPAQAPGRYTVHEWGLVNITADGNVELATGPGLVTRDSAHQDPGTGMALKPVLYFHLAAGEVEVDVAARMTFGSMLERYPATAMHGPDLRWDRVPVVSRMCGSHTYPMVGGAGCQAIADNYCEAAELAAYETSDASCLVVDGRDYNHLFYRGGGRGLSLPITVSHTGDTLRVSNASDYDIPLALSIISDTVGRNDVDLVLDRRVATPTVTIRRVGHIPAGSSADMRIATSADEAVTMVRAELALLGLTAPEVQAFMNAWEEAVFRVPNVATSVVYLLPPELVDQVSTLSLTPPPEATRRAIMMRG